MLIESFHVLRVPALVIFHDDDDDDDDEIY
jgi:hypothetical protein